jgi:hypothetical protein
MDGTSTDLGETGLRWYCGRIACHTVGDARELIWLLLDRGGDLDLARPNEGNWSAPSAREAASRRPNTWFLKAVEE